MTPPRAAAWTAAALVLALVAAPAPARGEEHGSGQRRGITSWTLPQPWLLDERVQQARALPPWAEDAWQAARLDTADHAGVRTALAGHEVAVIDSVTTQETVRCVILVRAGSGSLPVSARYEPGISRIDEMTLWRVDGGKVTVYPIGLVPDGPVSADSLHQSLRSRGGRVRVRPGTVLAVEFVRTARTFTASWLERGTSLDGIDFSSFRLRLPGDAVPEVAAVPESLGRATHDEDGWLWKLPPHRNAGSGDFTVLPDQWQLAVRIAPRDGQALTRGSFPTWESFGLWVGGQLAPVQRSTPRLQAFVDSLRAAHPDRAALARALAEYVQRLTYVSVDIHMAIGGGLVPRPAEAVWLDGRGDCKDKASLLCTLLRLAGVRAWPVLARVGSTFLPTPWPCVGAFDHMVTAIELPGERRTASVETARLGRLMLFDPTSTRTPWGEIPSALAGGSVLLLSDSLAFPLEAPPLSPERNHDACEALVRVDSASTVRATLVQSAAGPLAEFETALTEGPLTGKLAGATGHVVAAVWPGATLDSCAMTRDSSGAVQIGLRIRREGYGARTVRLPMRTWSLFAAQDAVPDSSERDVRPRCWHTRDRVVIMLPPGAEIDTLPAAVDERSDFGRVLATVERSGDTLTWTCDAAFPGGVVTAARYPELRDLLRTLRRLQGSALTVWLGGGPRPASAARPANTGSASPAPPPARPHGRPGIRGG